MKRLFLTMFLFFALVISATARDYYMPDLQSGTQTINALTVTTGSFSLTAADGDRGVSIDNNTSAPTTNPNMLYPLNNVWQTRQNDAAAGSIVVAPTAGQVTLTGPTAPRSVVIADSASTIAVVIGAKTTVAAADLVIPITHTYIAKTTGVGAEALSLANGKMGQIINISLVVDGGGAGTLTPTTKSGFTTIVFDDAGDQATLLFADAVTGWIILGTAGVAAPPVITQ